MGTAVAGVNIEVVVVVTVEGGREGGEGGIDGGGGEREW
jgi:hypothetical protein